VLNFIQRTDKQVKQAPVKRPFDISHIDMDNKDGLDSMSQKNFKARQATPAYQEMLVCSSFVFSVDMKRIK
jgi:hypothetical protein